MSQFGVDGQSVHFETECHSSKMSQQTVCRVDAYIVWDEMPRGRFMGGQIVNAPTEFVYRKPSLFIPPKDTTVMKPVCLQR
jgi:hypothetical protein